MQESGEDLEALRYNILAYGVKIIYCSVETIRPVFALLSTHFMGNIAIRLDCIFYCTSYILGLLNQTLGTTRIQQSVF